MDGATPHLALDAPAALLSRNRPCSILKDNSTLATSGRNIRFCTGYDGAHIAYTTTGKGPPLVRASTWLSHLEHDVSNLVWRPWNEEFARHFSLTQYDQRGCGLSDRDVDDISFEAWVGDLEAVADAAGLQRFFLFGMSQGASISVAYAARHPERVMGLVILGGYAQGRMKRAMTPEQREEAETLIKLIEVGWGSETPAFRQVFTTLFMPDASPEQLRAFDELQRISCSVETAKRIVSGFDQVDVRELATRVKCPTLVLHSTGDSRSPFEQGRLLASLIPGARFATLDSRNHLIVETEPAWHAFMAQAQDFVREIFSKEAASSPIAPALSAREAELAEWVAQGLDNHQIAAQLGLSEKTVRNRVSELLDRLGVETRARAIVLMRESGYGRR